MWRQPRPGRAVVATSLLLTIACSGGTPSSPSPATTTTSEDTTPTAGVTLKIDAPVLNTPSNGRLWPSSDGLVFSVRHVRGRYATFPVSYEVEVRNAAGSVLATAIAPEAAGSATTTNVPVREFLEGGQPLQWRARARHDNAVGPWSPSRILTLERLVRMDDTPNMFKVGEEKTPRVEFVQQGIEVDCTDRAQLTSSDSQVLAIIGNKIRALAIGDAAIRADCDGVTGLTENMRVREIWQGEFTPRECRRTFGDFDRCQAIVSVSVRTLRLELLQTGPSVPGELSGFGTTMPVTVAVSGSKIVSLRGKFFACALGTIDDEHEWHEFEIDNDRATLTVNFRRDSSSSCSAAALLAPTSRWIITGDVRLER